MAIFDFYLEDSIQKCRANRKQKLFLAVSQADKNEKKLYSRIRQ